MKVIATNLLVALVLGVPHGNTNQGKGHVDLYRCGPINCVGKKKAKRWRRIVRPYRSWLRSTGACESGGSYSAHTGNGYYGKYQFDLRTWYGVGGRGLPSVAPPIEQDYRAVKLLRLRGTSPWPVCG